MINFDRFYCLNDIDSDESMSKTNEKKRVSFIVQRSRRCTTIYSYSISIVLLFCNNFWPWSFSWTIESYNSQWQYDHWRGDILMNLNNKNWAYHRNENASHHYNGSTMNLIIFMILVDAHIFTISSWSQRIVCIYWWHLENDGKKNNNHRTQLLKWLHRCTKAKPK